MSALVLILALAVRTLRLQAPQGDKQTKTNLEQRQRTQRAVALLYQALIADKQVSYTAISDTTVSYGGRQINSKARVIHAPRRLALEYIGGDAQGVAAGFNERWFWRKADLKDPAEPRKVYAEVQEETEEMAAKRFALILDNYSAAWEKSEDVAGRPADVILLRPFQPVAGAQGPGKRLWIDSETHLTVGVETLNHQMQPVMRSMLTEVRVQLATADKSSTSSLAQSPLMSVSLPKDESWVAEDMGDNRLAVEKTTGVQPPQPRILPPGFQLESVGVHRCRLPGKSESQAAALSRYTDGMNTLTIFAMKPQKEASGSRTEETCNFGLSTLVMRDTERGRMIAMADLPKPILQSIVDSAHIKWASDGSETASPEQK
ncbi:MAG: hypothetical protein M3347_14860 [Armatimonadota bacterium]|nr:hypothetical protein [Armatimonadota bacterium]